MKIGLRLVVAVATRPVSLSIRQRTCTPPGLRSGGADGAPEVAGSDEAADAVKASCSVGAGNSST